MTALARRVSLHYAWIVVVVTFLVLLASAGVRSAPGVLIKPLEGTGTPKPSEAPVSA